MNTTQRISLGNESLRLEFDPRTSDTMYNYIWVKQGDGIWTNWVRAYNFGIDVGAPSKRNPQENKNTIGVHLDISVRGQSARVIYPSPLVSYSEFANAKSLEQIHNYPDLPANYGSLLDGAESSLEFSYDLDEKRPSFLVSGRVLSGKVASVVYIISALWTDNRQLPTHLFCEGMRPVENHGEGYCLLRRSFIENIAYAIFYRADGLGLPFALLPQLPNKSTLCNLYDNSFCLNTFHTASTNQEYIPHDPPVVDSNDTGYTTEPDVNGGLRAVRVVFFPELGWGRGGRGFTQVSKIESIIHSEYFEAARSWKRKKNDMKLFWTWILMPPDEA